jgi:hypothetical protein
MNLLSRKKFQTGCRSRQRRKDDARYGSSEGDEEAGIMSSTELFEAMGK